MRAVIQRVSKASVNVDGKTVGKIGKGLLVYLGVAKGDCTKHADFISRKIAGMRIFEDDQGKMNLSVHDVDGEILLISNFTLQADCRKGNRPGFDNAEKPEKANELYEHVAQKIKAKNIPVAMGRFGEYMKIENISDGPINIVLDSGHLNK